MKIYNINNNYFSLLLLACICFISIQTINAQFTITESFKGNESKDIVIGDDASLTSGVEDPLNDGWLRLTKDVNQAKGFAYIDKSFPSTLGVIVDFEYTMWRSRNDWGNGADGIGVFLFDGTIQNFKLGGYGGSLGYAPNAPSTPKGLTGGYIGIGLDSYGNFGNDTEGRIGRITRDENNAGEVPNTVVLRGPTTTNPSTTNRFLAGVKIGNRNGTANEIRSRNEIDYNTVSPIRPNSSQFYRRVQIEIIPLGESSGYEIIVRWAKAYNGEFTELISYTTNNAPPALLKLGFAASTGGSYNFHEIRNVLVTTPGNLRVIKKSNKNVLRSVNAGNNENEITYNIEVINDTESDLQNIEFEDILTDGNGNILAPAAFEITNITSEGFSNGTVLPQSSSSNQFSGSLNLVANSTGKITIKGNLKEVPSGNIIRNTASAFPTDISDEDLGNNTSVINTPVIAEGIDLVLNKTVDQPCLDASNGNNFSIEVSNLGANNLNYSQTNRVIVRETLPSGTNISDKSHPGWTYAQNGNNLTFTKTGSGTLSSGRSFDDNINYTLTSNSAYTNNARVELNNTGGGTNQVVEPPENRGNNSDSVTVISQPSAPAVSSPVYYCEGEEAVALSATADDGFDLVWYLNEGGTARDIAFTPNTNTPGSKIYYVAQTNGSCQSELSEIEVIVIESPEAGSILGTSEICAGNTPNELSSDVDGSGPGTISYKWEVSTDNGTTWQEISGANNKTFQPETVRTTSFFRRITVSESPEGVFCDSDATAPVVITTKRCGVISNPMLPSKAKNN